MAVITYIGTSPAMGLDVLRLHGCRPKAHVVAMYSYTWIHAVIGCGFTYLNKR